VNSHLTVGSFNADTASNDDLSRSTKLLNHPASNYNCILLLCRRTCSYDFAYRPTFRGTKFCGWFADRNQTNNRDALTRKDCRSVPSYGRSHIIYNKALLTADVLGGKERGLINGSSYVDTLIKSC